MNIKTKFLFQEGLNTRTFKVGDVIFRQGDDGDGMYTILEGEVKILINGELIDVLHKKNIFGEMALIDQEKRSATAIANTDCKLNFIDQRRFLYLVQKTPYFALDVLSVIANRLRNMNQMSVWFKKFNPSQHNEKKENCF